jgi:hypothetical protein
MNLSSNCDNDEMLPREDCCELIPPAGGRCPDCPRNTRPTTRAPAYEKPHNQQTYEKPHIALREAVEKALDGLVGGWKFALVVDRILSLLAPPQEGWVMVPREPTEAMFTAGWSKANEVAPNALGIVTDSACGEIYRVMLSAAPQHGEG